ncbi:ABC transporter permease [Solirubrobacter taibaiensis]|nr:ABC transporter permease [Solirubrobacter taibaiensis]
MKRPWLAVPGLAWLAAFFLVAFYAVVAVGFGNITDVYDPVPHWNPLDWNVGYILQALEDILPGGRTWPVFVRTLIYVVIAVLLSLAIGYPVAYYVSRYVTGRKKALLLILLVAPFWISYLMRMFAWTNLLADGGYAATVLNALSLDAIFLDGTDWLGGQHVAVVMGLVYGYVPYLILPLYASLDRIDERLIEAARDLGASSSGAFRRVVLPLSRAGTLGGIVLIALPMFGDYYTPDLMSGSPRTAMLGNTINNYVQGGPDKALGAAMTLLLSAFLLVFMLYYLRELRRENTV